MLLHESFNLKEILEMGILSDRRFKIRTFLQNLIQLRCSNSGFSYGSFTATRVFYEAELELNGLGNLLWMPI